MLLQAATGATIDTFTGFGTTILGWFITSFTSIITWMLANPISFVWLVVSLIGATFVFLQRTLGN